MDDADAARGAEEIGAIRAALGAMPPPDLAALEGLLARLQPLAQADGTLAQQAVQLELQILGTILTQQATSLRALARQLQHLARWLPPAFPEQN